MWRTMPQQQQRGAQFRRRGEAPAEAVKDRAAQEHDRADQDAAPGGAAKPPVYPAGRLQDEEGDNTPSAPAPSVNWDDVVQPPRKAMRRSLSELEGDERGEDAENEPSLSER